MDASQGTAGANGKSPAGGESRPGFRTKTVATRITPEELAEIESTAERAGKPLSEWLRETALHAARRETSNPLELVLAEIWAVRYALLNLFRAGAQANLEDRAMPPEFVAQIRAEADSQKLQQARKLVEDFTRLAEKNRGI